MATRHERGQNAALAHTRRMQEILADLCLEAMNFSAKPKVEETARQWLSRASLDPEDPQSAEMIAEALLLDSRSSRPR